MKTFFKALLLPVAAFALASAGAVGTNEANISKAAKPPITAFIHDPLQSSCRSVTVSCNTVSGPTCTYVQGANSWTVFRKATPQATTCALPLYMDQP
jgi:hypothetical protein